MDHGGSAWVLHRQLFGLDLRLTTLNVEKNAHLIFARDPLLKYWTVSPPSQLAFRKIKLSLLL